MALFPQNWIAEQRARFREALATFDAARPALLLTHNDADGLGAAAILARTFGMLGRAHDIRVLGRGENPWMPGIGAEISERRPGGLLVLDLGTREGAIAPGLPTIVIDHHVPAGTPGGAAVISGYGREPQPTSSLLAYWCAGALAPVEDLLWIAALGIIGDLGEKAGLDELAAARKRHKLLVLKEATVLVNAPRRTAAGDAGPALALMLAAAGPEAIATGDGPDARALRAARAEVKAALDAGKRVPPKVKNGVALIRLASPCQIHPLVAQSWRGRLKNDIVIAANIGYRPGWVHFAARTATDADLIAFLRTAAPPGADENYGSGHRQATGGALKPRDWNIFVDTLGFEPDMHVPA